MFKDKTVVITGASAGVGAACARSFAELGARLVLIARGKSALDAIAEELGQKTEVLTIVMDVADTAACATLAEQCISRFGAIHILVNNAGLHHRGDMTTRTAMEITAMVDVNLRAPLQLTAELLPSIQAAGGGAIVMVGSLAGRAPLQGAATYAATKAGLRAFTYSLSDELAGSGVHVGVVSVGPIDTGFIMDNIDAVEDIVYSQPMSSAAEVAASVVAIARGEAVEISMPLISGKMLTLAYLFPWLRRSTRGLLYRIGKNNKAKYRQR
ncbi:SDR family NAD(P)-dependent oxidoreductase [Oceanicoccus sagamiensis]|uniref:Short-chain dehydrogenase n=1 Tax=Oceanicoccus sagamiensis TaxID=716816 RepID=A0A1X9NCQ6_9GAMM|nr:SDR family NAD(P)-dependent oxidoreductase [Oceanicoccus sagamiensis]ARN75810.1 short-chain dehydrogenase [Oceanicoccus sagamiensis]